MEVDGAHFRRQLLQILKAIASSTFVSFDLEMSGINTRTKHSADLPQEPGKPSLQKAYAEMKSAAETYQILQMGITCVSEDHEKGYYLARPYNFNVSPLSAEGVNLKLERTFTFSTSACDFLTKSRFDFGKVFQSGVPYLSKTEEENLREEYEERIGQSARIPDIIVPPDDIPTIEFMRLIRKTVNAWLKTDNSKPGLDFCNIGNAKGPLNGFQRRIAYQVVRNEFPQCRAFSRQDGYFMQVELLNLKQEQEYQAKKLKQFDSLLAKQTGLRYIFEALTGGELAGINAEWFCDKDSEKPKDQLRIAEFELTVVRQALRLRKPLIVGHNLFTDLGFLYATFVEPLPHSVKEFQAEIHELFPEVVDTKYIATHGDGAMAPRSSLKDLLDPFRQIHIPLIVLHEAHGIYNASFGKEHEAGFDSWMTAEVFVKLSAKLYAERLADGEFSIKGTRNDSSDSEASDHDGGVSLLSPSHNSYSRHPSDISQSGKNQKSAAVGVASFHDDLPPAWHALKINEIKLTDSSTPLDDDLDDEGSGIGQNAKNVNESIPIQWIPSMSHQFWKHYCNRLRVNSSEIGVCDLGETRHSI